MNTPPILSPPPTAAQTNRADGVQHIARLRVALQNAQALHAADGESSDPAAHRRRLQAASRAVDEAFTPLFVLFSPGLLFYSQRLARSSHSPEPLDGDDLAQQAWAETLAYLSDPAKGDRLQNDEHFGRFLRRCAYTAFLNKQKQQNALLLLDAPPEGGGDTRGEQLTAPRVLPDILHYAEQGPWADWLHALFGGDDSAFRAACRVPPRRRAVVYQAFVLISIAGFLRVVRAQSGARGAGLLRELALLMNLPPPFWQIAENAAENAAAPTLTENERSGKSQDAGITDEIMQTVCAACGVPLMRRPAFHVMRHEVRKQALGSDTKAAMGKKENE